MEEIKENKNDLLNKKRRMDSNLDDEDDENKDLKTSKLNLLKLSENSENKKESEKDEEELSFLERIKNKSRKEIIEMSRKRVMKRFQFKPENLRNSMIKKLNELDPNDPCYHDLIFLIGDLRKII